MERIIKEMLKEVTDTFRDDENLISLTPVGSFANPNKKLEKFNDLDLVFVFRKINAEDVKKLKELGKTLKESFSDKNTDIEYTLKIGPIKFASKKRKMIIIHFLVYSQKGYKIYESAVTRFSFQHYKPALGKLLKEISEIRKIKKKDLFNEIDGIPVMRKWIENKIVYYLEPKENGIKIISMRLDSKQYMDIIFYSVLRLASNMVRLKGMYADIDKKMCNAFERHYPIILKQFPEKTLILKERTRKGKGLSTKEIEELKNESLEFINQCEYFLRKS